MTENPRFQPRQMAKNALQSAYEFSGRCERREFLPIQTFDPEDDRNLSKLSFTRFKRNMTGCMRETFNVVAGYPYRFAQKSNLGRVASMGKLALLPVCYKVMEGQPDAAQALAVIDLAGVYIMQRMQLNSHFNAFAVPLGALLAGQMALLGSVESYSSAFMVSVVALRNTAMASMADTEDTQGLRSKISFGLTSLNLAALGAIAYAYERPSVLLLTASILLTAWATSMINSKSHIARALRLPGDVNGTFYHAAFTGSGSAVISSVMSALNRMTTMKESDIPVSMKGGDAFTFGQRIRAYAHTLMKPDSRKDYNFEKEPEF